MKSRSAFTAVILSALSKIAFASLVTGVPYFYQYNNTINPGGSCQNTSIAMCIKYFGGTAEYPDAISSYYGTSQAQTVSGLQSVFNSEAAYFNLTVRDIGHSNGTFADIQNLLAAGLPVIVHGYFTGYGHVMVVVGYDGVSYTCNDPAGKWSQQYQYGGYCQCNATEGSYVKYSKAAFEQAIGPDGTIWYHEFTNTPVNPPPTTNDLTPPTSSISVVNATSYKTSGFTANFSDTDNPGGSGIEKSFYSVLHWTGTEWRANSNKGFFCDNFDAAIHSDWNAPAGNWATQNNVLLQSDNTNTNTSFSASLNQSLSNRYIYHFLGKMNGSSSNRSAGIHIFTDDNTQTNRGNNYLIQFKPATSSILIYKVQNNLTGSPIKTFTGITISDNTWYDIKIMYDRTTGKFTIWMNDTLAGTYTDASNPIFSGTGFSLRTTECELWVNNLKVYRSRALTSASVSVGPSNADVMYQSPDTNITSYACKIKSLTVDSAGNVSGVANQDLLIDWTPPASVATVNDGSGSDINQTIVADTLRANFTASSDPNSGVVEYWYAIGTAAGDSNVVGWTNNGSSLNVLSTGLSLQNGITYFISIKAKNGAGLYSSTISSNGQTYVPTATGINTLYTENHLINVFPIPASDYLNIESQGGLIGNYTAEILNATGQVISEQLINFVKGSTARISVTVLDNGIYFLQLKSFECINEIKPSIFIIKK